MKEKITRTIFLLLLTFTSTHSARSQWVFTNGPVLAGKGYIGATEGFGVIDSTLFAGTMDADGLGGGTSFTTDYGATWVEISALQYIPTYAAIACNGILFAGTYDGLYRSTDNGSSWVQSGAMNEVRSLAVINANVFAGTVNQGVFLSSDSGASWAPVNSGFDSTDDVAALAFSGTNLIAGAYGNGIFISTNNGTSWIPANTGLTHLDVSCLTLVGTNLFAGTGGGIFLSTNNGANWANIYSGSAITTIAASGNFLFAGGDIGDYLSTDNGRSWSTVDSGSKFAGVLALAVVGPYLFAGVGSGGVWRRPLSDFAQLGVTELSAIKQQLTTNPNPFTQSTEITFTSPSAGYAEVSIVNMLGVEVARLFSGELGAGEHSFTWDADGTSALRAPPGVYECLVRMNGQLQTLPVVLIR